MPKKFFLICLSLVCGSYPAAAQTPASFPVAANLSAAPAGQPVAEARPAEGRVLSRHQLYGVSAERTGRFVWRDAFVVMHPSGKVYGMANDELFGVAPAPMAITRLARQASLLTAGKDNKLYFRRGTHLWSLEP